MIEYTVKVSDDGIKAWYLDDKLHREDGPAVERSDGYKAWYLNGKELTEQEFLKRTGKTNKNQEVIDCLRKMLDCLEGE